MTTSFRSPGPRIPAAVICICAAVWSGYPSAAAAQDLRSTALAKELSSLMTAAGLDAIALQDPEAPDRFIAAMLVPDVQLLMVTARHSSPDYVVWQIGQKGYREVYALLQQSGLTESRLFFQDLGVDGLPPPGGEGVDVMYERGAQTVFDGGGKNGGDTKRGDEKKLLEADAQYSRLLQLAIGAVRGAAAKTSLE